MYTTNRDDYIPVHTLTVGETGFCVQVNMELPVTIFRSFLMEILVKYMGYCWINSLVDARNKEKEHIYLLVEFNILFYHNS